MFQGTSHLTLQVLAIHLKDYNQFKIDRNYNYQDIITVSKDTIPDYDEKVKYGGFRLLKYLIYFVEKCKN